MRSAYTAAITPRVCTSVLFIIYSRSPKKVDKVPNTNGTDHTFRFCRFIPFRFTPFRFTPFRFITFRFIHVALTREVSAYVLEKNGSNDAIFRLPKDASVIFRSKEISLASVVQRLRDEGLSATRQGLWKLFRRVDTSGTISRRGRQTKLSQEILQIVEDQMQRDDETTAVQLEGPRGYQISLSTVFIIRCRRVYISSRCSRASFACVIKPERNGTGTVKKRNGEKR